MWQIINTRIYVYGGVSTWPRRPGTRAARGRDNIGIAARREVITAELLSKKLHTRITSCVELHWLLWTYVLVIDHCLPIVRKQWIGLSCVSFLVLKDTDLRNNSQSAVIYFFDVREGVRTHGIKTDLRVKILAVEHMWGIVTKTTHIDNS